MVYVMFVSPLSFLLCASLPPPPFFCALPHLTHSRLSMTFAVQYCDVASLCVGRGILQSNNMDPDALYTRGLCMLATVRPLFSVQSNAA